MHQDLGKSVVCKQSHCDLQSVDLFARQRSVHYYSSIGASYDKASQGENSIFWLFYFPLIIARLLVNLAKIKCGRELAKDFTILQDAHTKSYDKKIF